METVLSLLDARDEELRLKESRIQELEDRTHEIENRQELMKALHGQSGSLARQPHEIVEELHALTQMIDHQASVALIRRRRENAGQPNIPNISLGRGIL